MMSVYGVYGSKKTLIGTNLRLHYSPIPKDLILFGRWAGFYFRNKKINGNGLFMILTYI
jgi:hypothetical protein